LKIKNKIYIYIKIKIKKVKNKKNPKFKCNFGVRSSASNPGDGAQMLFCSCLIKGET
jgi:hypothetical protein